MILRWTVCLVLAGVLVALSATSALADPIHLGPETNNSGYSPTLAELFTIDVSEGTGAYEDYVCFEVSNTYDGSSIGTLGSNLNITITDFYVYDAAGRLDDSDYVLPDDWSTPARPEDLPGGWTASWSTDADPSQMQNGIAAEESLTFYVSLASGETFEDFLGDMRFGDDASRVGIKVGGIGEYSETFSNVPEPAGIALLGLGLAGLVGVRARRRRKAS